MRRPVTYSIAVGGCLLILGLSVRFENLEERRTRQRALDFNAADYARDLWDNRMAEALDQAVDAGPLIHLFNQDMQIAMTQGRTLGESRVHAYLLKGQGTVVARDQGGVSLSVTEPNGRPEVRIVLRPFVSGNAVRDASGLVDVSDFSDTMKFNQISFEINKLVVQEVIQPFLQNAPSTGQSIRFVGAAEVAEDATEKHDFGETPTDVEGTSHHLLKVIPIRLILE